MRAIKEPTFHQKMWVLWETAETISKNMGSLGDSSAENMGSLEANICVISTTGVLPPSTGMIDKYILLLYPFKIILTKFACSKSKLFRVWPHGDRRLYRLGIKVIYGGMDER